MGRRTRHDGNSAPRRIHWPIGYCAFFLRTAYTLGRLRIALDAMCPTRSAVGQFSHGRTCGGRAPLTGTVGVLIFLVVRKVLSQDHLESRKIKQNPDSDSGT